MDLGGAARRSTVRRAALTTICMFGRPAPASLPSTSYGKLRSESTRHAVDHRDAGPGVERADALDLAARRNDGDVADAADVLERAPVRRRRKQHRVGDRHERRALPSRRDVAHAKVAHDVDARALGDDRRFARSARWSARARARCVCPCDAIAAMSSRATPASAITAIAASASQSPRSKSSRQYSARRRSAERAQRAARARLACTTREVKASSSTSMRPSLASREAHDRGADSVERRARHQADDDAGCHS